MVGISWKVTGFYALFGILAAGNVNSSNTISRATERGAVGAALFTQTEPCMICSSDGTITGGTEHRFGSTHCHSAIVGYCMDCQAFNSCHTNDQSGECYEFHYSCQSGSPSPELEKAQLAQLSRALEQSDSRGLVAIIAASNGAFRYNSRREAIQIANCKGRIIAHFPVPANIGLKLRAAL
jgi:hypothetical protein